MTKRKLKDQIYKEICRVLNPHGLLVCHHVYGRSGLLYIDPRNIQEMTDLQHKTVHKNLTEYRNAYYWKPPEYPENISLSDYRQLLKAFKKCEFKSQLVLCFETWLEALK